MRRRFLERGGRSDAASPSTRRFHGCARAWYRECWVFTRRPFSGRRRRKTSLRRGCGGLGVMPPIRILTAVPICDGHDSAINTINLELVRQGIEVIYLGYNRSAKDIVRAAIQEDVVAVGLSSYNGGHVEFFGEVVDRLESARLRPGVSVFGGGGGTITHEDAAIMYKRGVNRIFFAGTPLENIAEYVQSEFSKVAQTDCHRDSIEPDSTLARELTLIENGMEFPLAV